MLQANAASWEQAIKLGTDMLIASGAVEQRYHDTIIRSVEKLGPYIVIAPNFAMPHARPEDGVNRTAFALVTLKEPVYFEGEAEPVDVMITLAGSSSDEHMQGLTEVTRYWKTKTVKQASIWIRSVPVAATKMSMQSLMPLLPVHNVDQLWGISGVLTNLKPPSSFITRTLNPLSFNAS